MRDGEWWLDWTFVTKQHIKPLSQLLKKNCKPQIQSANATSNQPNNGFFYVPRGRPFQRHSRKATWNVTNAHNLTPKKHYKQRVLHHSRRTCQNKHVNKAHARDLKSEYQVHQFENESNCSNPFNSKISVIYALKYNTIQLSIYIGL